MRTWFVVLLVILVVIIAGCTSSSPGIVVPKTRIAMEGSPRVDDCFLRVNDSAHSESTGSSRQIVVTDFVSNICSQPMDNLIVRGTFYDRDGRAFATVDRYVGRIDGRRIAGFTLSVETPYTDLFSYKLQPFIGGPEKLF